MTHKGLYCLGYGLFVSKMKLKNPRYSHISDLGSLMHLTHFPPHQHCYFLPPEPSSFPQVLTLHTVVMVVLGFSGLAFLAVKHLLLGVGLLIPPPSIVLFLTSGVKDGSKQHIDRLTESRGLKRNL